ncbi:gluconolaconase [Salinibacter sp. 10B]|uniref:SMP-30/gluconolactonase/LRE family protein n=1 Tax=Salinibacter sp. 10B TaxID=1923971 RepID=UPI000CF4AEEB|nr:SMP-30/gluconolactonase/LRE family protein [Salinibacter sp. 10B]PQJ35348.1 gluconolaconase [Salinibacter sp. 10B]
MKQPLPLTITVLFLIGIASGPALAQETPSSYPVGNPVGTPAVPSADQSFAPASSNVTVYGAIYSAESCTYDPERDVIVVPNRGAPQSARTNDAFISFINHDGSVRTPRWIGVQSPSARAELDPPLTLNHPLGSDIANGTLHLADQDGGTSEDDPSVAVVRQFDLKTGTPVGEIRIENAPWINDIEVTNDGTIYVTQTGDLGQDPDPSTWRVWKITPDGTPEVFAQGDPLRQPNGLGIDRAGHIVVVNYGNDEVLTFSRDGELLKTEKAAQPGGDGLVIMDDGTKYVSSVAQGGISRIRPGESAELIARNIPSAASMCYDPKAHQLVVPMNPNNGLAFVSLE